MENGTIRGREREDDTLFYSYPVRNDVTNSSSAHGGQPQSCPKVDIDDLSRQNKNGIIHNSEADEWNCLMEGDYIQLMVSRFYYRSMTLCLSTDCRTLVAGGGGASAT